jgi:hypothetical protein
MQIVSCVAIATSYGSWAQKVDEDHGDDDGEKLQADAPAH